MKNLIFILFILFSINLKSQINSISENNTEFPTLLKYNIQEKYTLEKFNQWFKNTTKDSLYSFEILEDKHDKLNIRHIKIQEYYNKKEITKYIV
jgi:hypothetical protein